MFLCKIDINLCSVGDDDSGPADFMIAILSARAHYYSLFNLLKAILPFSPDLFFLFNRQKP